MARLECPAVRYPTQPMGSLVSLSSTAHSPSPLKRVRIISRLSLTLLCGGQPARGPTSGSDAHLYSISASLSRQGLSRILSVCIITSFCRLTRASLLLARTGANLSQTSICGQLPQLSRPLPMAHLRISHIVLQNTVFAPSIRHPSQLMCSGRIVALFSLLHNLAVFSRRAWSLFLVAMYASHFSQSSPQKAISLFIIVCMKSDAKVHLFHNILK